VTRRVYDKLVRDLTPEIVQRNGHTCGVETLHDDQAFRRALRDKLVEEAREAAAARDEDLATELADLQEVIDALIDAYELTQEAVRNLQHRRQEERSGFSQRLRLLWTE
jgi:predicted house-cleaning noncanonical NTP pyrophosphatase (MazG superfamily)